ncbi:MAG: nicotinate-nucleotide diphosphorylase (carboxylating) [Verrucomicrobia bacterium]|nr:nicotinate-nucleotide diphosphorylase (carboxylating) [Verrucomicrobiota bacterium]
MLTPRTELLIDLALEEDLGLGDLTSRALFPPGHRRRGWIEARQDLVVCGVEIAARVFARVDPALRVRLLAAERSALNFLQRLSGIATHVRTHVDLLQGTGVRLADTRKTTPGWRALEKHAVRCGGGANHRSSLGEHVLIKDNHLAAAGAEVILLDNFPPEGVRAAAALIAGRARVEVSGGVRRETLRAYAVPGVDVISVGALAYSAPAADLSLTVPARGRAV